MLVLSRKNQEAVIVGGPDGGQCLLKVTVIEIRGKRVRLAFEAADGVTIHRSELCKQWPAGTRGAAANEATDRWEDDGGGADRPAAGLAMPPAALGRAGDQR